MHLEAYSREGKKETGPGNHGRKNEVLWQTEKTGSALWRPYNVTLSYEVNKSGGCIFLKTLFRWVIIIGENNFTFQKCLSLYFKICCVSELFPVYKNWTWYYNAKKVVWLFNESFVSKISTRQLREIKPCPWTAGLQSQEQIAFLVAKLQAFGFC